MSRKICGWDVGIKHLAYCIIDVDDNRKFKIEKWANIDISGCDKMVCCGTLKNKKSCHAKAKFYKNEDEEIKYYCGSHITKIDKQTIEKEFLKEYIGQDRCSFTQRGGKSCGKKANSTFDQKVCCRVHKERLLKDKLGDVNAKPIKNKKCTSIDPQILCQKMFQMLDSIEGFEHVNEVYIENQPTHINPTMKTISAMLFSYFVYFFHQRKLYDRIVKFVSPTVKIIVDALLINFAKGKIDNHNTIKKNECKCRICKLSKDIEENKKKYNEEYPKYEFSYDSTKELGVMYTEKILLDTGLSMDLIKDEKKLDDPCDAFLHSYKQI
jgi:hypothetical protein